MCDAVACVVVRLFTLGLGLVHSYCCFFCLLVWCLLSSCFFVCRLLWVVCCLLGLVA